MDRIDLRIEVPQVMPSDLIRRRNGEASGAVAARVVAARDRQQARYVGLGLTDVSVNAHCPTALIEDVANADAVAVGLLADAADHMRMSARGYHRVLKLARTLADLDGVDRVGKVHVAEAVSYRVFGEGVAKAA